jgi:hypothetical protein
VTAYTGCTCAAADPSTVPGQTLAQRLALRVTPGKCASECGTLPLFLVLLFFAMLTNFANSSPTTAIRFRSRPFARHTRPTAEPPLLTRSFLSFVCLSDAEYCLPM